MTAPWAPGLPQHIHLPRLQWSLLLSICALAALLYTSQLHKESCWLKVSKGKYKHQLWILILYPKSLVYFTNCFNHNILCPAAFCVFTAITLVLFQKKEGRKEEIREKTERRMPSGVYLYISDDKSVGSWSFIFLWRTLFVSYLLWIK